MEEISLRLKIANREYPMKVKSEEEENVRKAAKLINDRVKIFRNQFGIDDKQDLLAMVAFDCMIKFLSDHGEADTGTEALSALEELNKKLEAALR